MKFCRQCRNMYYLTLAHDNNDGGDENNAIVDPDSTTLEYYCRHCGFREPSGVHETFVLSEKHKSPHDVFHHILNPYTKHDPTLPRVYHVPCPNVECKTHASTSAASPEVLFIRYDNDNLKYIYLCCICDHAWHN